MPPEFSLTEDALDDDRHVVAVRGEIDLFTAPELKQKLTDAIEGGKSRIVGNEHPTQKPVEIFARPMRRHTKTNDICFEPFSGSGSQIITRFPSRELFVTNPY